MGYPTGGGVKSHIPFRLQNPPLARHKKFENFWLKASLPQPRRVRLSEAAKLPRFGIADLISPSTVCPFLAFQGRVDELNVQYIHPLRDSAPQYRN